EGAPYYTMELLEGHDLKSLKMLPWRNACAVLRDVASALAVIHSRRLVHRDVTPRNVRVSEDWRAKLIDFGALAPMGEPAALIGTPPFVAPEMLNRQPLDGRTDLYSLGALAYRLLTGRHAYMARTMEELPARWRTRPASPCKVVPDVPPALSALVLSLLSFEPLGRPTTAWEVIERLSAIAELSPEEDSSTARAYLITPTLVGRDREQAEFREKLDAALAGHGSTVWIKGPPGSGRSRLLTSLVLEARLKGVPVLRADGSEGRGGDLAVVRAFMRDLGASAEGANLEQRESLVTWLLELSKRDGLVVAIDDVQRADSASAAVIGKLLQAAPQHRVVLALTLSPDEEDAALPWLGMLTAAAPPLEARPLVEQETEALMRSVFGDAAHLKPLSHLVHRLASGNPGTCMSLAQHLLDRGAVHYESGRWVLPSDPHSVGLSDNVIDLFSARLHSLRPAARDLAAALASLDPLAPISRNHYHLLLPEDRSEQVFSALNELTSGNILRARGDADAFTHPALADAVRRGTSDAERREIHLRIAKLYESLPERQAFMLAWHLQQGGEHQRARELLVQEASATNTDRASAGFATRSRSHYRFGRIAYETALEHCERAGASPRAKFELRRSLVYLAVYYDPQLIRHSLPLIEQLRQDTGLVHWPALGEIADPSQRIWKCLELAKQAY
ncbi:MAG TPA: protein kinase, partial [Polyangiales bacterium]|nr:protein kinase [Polyangiales bacterium]